ncbi:MAG: NAD-dependent epimerase/dehydratase family protein [Candidatus Binatia bacterium]
MLPKVDNSDPRRYHPAHMQVLITGGTGFTGSHVTRRYLERGHDVRVLDAKPGRSFDDLRAAGAEILLGSVADRDAVRKATAGCELVQHIAASFRDVNASRAVYRSVNVEGTRIVGEEALRAGVRRVVYCSTEGVHGNVQSPPATEEAPIAPEDYYQQTKWEGEVAIREVAAQGLPISILRPTAIYGPGDPERFLMLFRMVRKGRFFIVGDGSATYHPLYIDNLVDAFELAAERPEAVGETFLVGDERYLSWNELVPMVAATLGVEVKIHYLPFRPVWLLSALVEGACRPFGVAPPLFRRRAEMFSHVRAFAIAKARRLLGYQPKVPLEEGLRRTAEWYRANGYL